MAFSGAQITRLGVTAWPTGLYGSFAGRAEAEEEVAAPRRRGGVKVKTERRGRKVITLPKDEYLLPFEAALLEIEKQEAEEQQRAAVLTRERAKQIAKRAIKPKKLGLVDPKQKLIILEEDDKIILEMLDDDLFS